MVVSHDSLLDFVDNFLVIEGVSNGRMKVLMEVGSRTIDVDKTRPKAE